MTPYTLTVSEAETQQLRKLVQRTQTTHRPILLTSEETSEPMAVLLESTIFEKLQRKERQLFHLQLRQLFQQISSVERQWENRAIREEFIVTFPANTYLLWKACPEDQEDLCVTLDLAVRRLAMEHFTREQVAALHDYLDLLQDGVPSADAIESGERRLIEAGLPPIPSGSDSLLQLYVDDL